MKRVLMVAMAATTLCACTKTMKFDSHSLAASGSEKPGMATVVVSDHQVSGRATAWWLDVSVDGKKVGDMRRGTYVHVSIPPGHHTVTVSYPALAFGTARPLAAESDFAADKTYYFVFDTAPVKNTWPPEEQEQFWTVPPAKGPSTIAGLTDRTSAKGAPH